MYDRVVEYLMFSSISTAQHSAAQSALHKAANQVRANQSVTMEASRQSGREPARSQPFI